MADLDDFFAKKDKKKSKGKKFSTADEIAKKLEETGKKIQEKSKKDKSLQATTGQDGEENGTLIQEDEWRDFEEEKKDYTGLKIQNITLNEQDNNEAENESDGDEELGMEENEAGEMVPRRKAAAGPWKVMAQPSAQEEPSANETERPQEEDIITKAPLRSGGTVSGGTYIPPSLRNQPPPMSFANIRSQKAKTAPDMNSEALFPTLSAASSAEPAGAWSRKKREDVGFEEVRNSKSHSSRYSDTSARMTPSKLSLGNKYGALTDQS